MELQLHRGADVQPYLAAVAALRIAVFREWPYLYDGDRDYETGYLATYARSPESLFVLAIDGGTVVGASTGVPLSDETAAFRSPFEERGIPVGSVFYFGESVLLPSYRGVGIGHRFFDERERYARELGRFGMTAFCAVERSADDARHPPAYRGNAAFWHKRGYRRHDDMECRLDWKEIDGTGPVQHRLGFWSRPLAPPS
jgi:GNAT superfamily N-acetyltransferase